MKNPHSNSSAITQDCTNFKNYLKNQFEIENFGEFICSYTFPLVEIVNLKKAAEKAGKKPESLRLYYGCNNDGTGHKLHVSLLDKWGDVIIDSSSLNSKASNNSLVTKTALASSGDNQLMTTAAFEEERKCPPGGTSDRFVKSLFS